MYLSTLFSKCCMQTVDDSIPCCAGDCTITVGNLYSH